MYCTNKKSDKIINLLVKDLGGLMKSMDQASVDKSSFEDLLQGLVYVHGTSAQDWVDGNLTGRCMLRLCFVYYVTVLNLGTWELFIYLVGDSLG